MAIVYCSWATGDDTNGTGTAANPYKTITKASTGLTGGDEVRVAKSPDPTALTGTTAWTLNGTTVTGTNTLFTTELAIGDFISAPDGNWYEVITIASNTSATLYKKYPSASASGHSSQKLGVTDTGAAAGSTTAIQTVSSSGNSTSALIISGGWDLATETQTGQTWFTQLNATTFDNRYGYGLYLSSKSYVSLDKLNFLRYNYGIYYYTSSNNTITSATCNSNNNYGIYYSSSSNNTITSATCNSNNTGIYYAAGSNNNTIVSATCNSNYNYGIYLLGCHNNTIVSATCNSNAYGIYYNNSSNNTIYALSTTGNTTAGIYSDNANNICHSATIAESTKVATGTAYYSDTRQYINNLGGFSYVYSNYATANSQNASAGGTGKEWKFAITDAARNSGYPFYIPIARVAFGSSGKVTVKVYFKKSGTVIAGALRCRYGQITWSDAAQDIIVTCPNDTSRNQVTLEFTPTEAGVVEIEAGAWYVSSTSQTVIVDDIEITQA